VAGKPVPVPVKLAQAVRRAVAVANRRVGRVVALCRLVRNTALVGVVVKKTK
jgi:hypothetical protein